MKKASEIIDKHFNDFKETNMQELIKIQYDRFNEAGLPPELLIMLRLEAKGGQCPTCKKEWQKIIVKNMFRQFYYFNPICRCYPICKQCERSMHRAFSMGTNKCTCEYDNSKKEKQIKQYMKNYRR